MVNKKMNILLTKKDVKRLRKAYNNYNIPTDYLSDEIRNIMIHEGIAKKQAINKILTLIYNI